MTGDQSFVLTVILIEVVVGLSTAYVIWKNRS